MIALPLSPRSPVPLSLQMMGRKLLVSLVIAGKATGEGLDSLDADDDMMTAMVRELLEEGGVGESADDIWSNLERERAAAAGAHRATSTSLTTMKKMAGKSLPAPCSSCHAIALPIVPISGEQMSLFG